MHPIIPTAVFLISAFSILSLLCVIIADRNKETLAWWLFITLSLPIVSSLIILFTSYWPETASNYGVSMIIADRMGTIMAASLVGSIGLLYSKDRPWGILVSVVAISNAIYFTNNKIFPIEAPERISVLLGSFIIAAIFLFVEKNVKFGTSPEKTPEEPPSKNDGGINSKDTYSSKSYNHTEATNNAKKIITYSAIGAGVSSFIILAFSLFGGEQRAFFAILNNPTHLTLPALLGAALGFGYALIKAK